MGIGVMGNDETYCVHIARRMKVLPKQKHVYDCARPGGNLKNAGNEFYRVARKHLLQLRHFRRKTQ